MTNRTLDLMRAEHGRLKGVAFHWRALAAMRAGFYRSMVAVDWARVDRLFFVCAGNICRSAYGNAFATQRGLSSTSAGLYATNDASAWTVMGGVARERGLDLAGHRARRIKHSLVAAGDLVVAFEPQHLSTLHDFRISAEFGHQVTLLGLFTSPPVPYMQDPYGLSRVYAATCAARIEQGVMALVSHLGECGRTGR